MGPIYLDHNATTPLAPEAAEAMAACWREHPGNPGSQHRFGREAHRALENAREALGRLLGARRHGAAPDRVLFTSGGTEANNLAVLGLAGEPPGRVLISAIEHPSVFALAPELRRRGFEVEILPVNLDGVICRERAAALLARPARLVSLMLANHETGALQPVAEIAAMSRAAGALVHTDAVQAVAKSPVSFRELGVDALTACAHKLHGPVGIGVLVLRGEVPLRPLFRGGPQQFGLRPGTESPALAVGMQRALELWLGEADGRRRRLAEMRDRLEQLLLADCPGATVLAAAAPRLPHVSSVAFPGVERQALLMALDLAGVCCSTGSACASGSSEPSPVLLAMGCSPELVRGALRFSLGVGNTLAEIDQAAGRILMAAKQLRRASPVEKLGAPARGNRGGPV